MKVVTAEQMRALDAWAMADGGIPGVVLMENAGRAVSDAVAGLATDRGLRLAGLRVQVLCGVGNNGGDGFVAARRLRVAGADVRVHVAGDAARVRGDAAAHLSALRGLGIEVEPLAADGWCDIVVDALLGTGSAGAPRGEVAEAVEWSHRQDVPVVAVDIPSGVDADTGQVSGCCVDADVTVTFAYPKLGAFLPPGADHFGRLVVDHIGAPWEGAPASCPRWVQRADVAAAMPHREREANKGRFGHVLVVGGSLGMGGAPSLTARAALRSGAGLVTVAAPAPAQRAIAAGLDESMTLPLSQDAGAFAACAASEALEAAERCDVVCAGPGVGRRAAAVHVMLEMVRRCDMPVVLDADGLYALAQDATASHGRSAALVLTPHPGECARLLGVTVDDVQADRVGAVREVARTHRCVALLKGARTLVCDGRDAGGGAAPLAISTTGNPGMATGGSGDVLTGIIGALIGQGLDPFAAAWCGAHVHGLAGDAAAGIRGQAGLIAGDIVDGLPGVWRELEAER